MTQPDNFEEPPYHQVPGAKHDFAVVRESDVGADLTEIAIFLKFTIS